MLQFPSQKKEAVMSLDRSLKSASSLVRHRNVLTRAEKLEVLKDEEKWDENKSVFGLPKVGHRKQEVGGKSKDEATAEGATPATGAAAPAAGAKAAAPAAGAKAAAPAAKAKK
jgi:small basic protein (TIGR04137 family)